MSTAAAAPLNYRQKIRPRPQFYLYSPADVRLECDVRAETFVFPRATETACQVYAHPKAPCQPGVHAANCPWRDSQAEPIPGVLPIRDLLGIQNPKGGQIINGITAQEVVEAIIGIDGVQGKLGKHGIRILFGDERDDEVRNDARVAYRDAKYHVSLALKASHLSINNKQKEADLAPIPPSKAVIAAMQYVVEYEQDFNPGAKFQCPECGFPFMEQGQRDSHIAVNHREAASRYGLTPSQMVPERGPEGFTPANQAQLTAGVSREAFDTLLDEVNELKRLIAAKESGPKRAGKK